MQRRPAQALTAVQAWLLALLLALGLVTAAPPALAAMPAPTALQVSSGQPNFDAWPAVQVLAEGDTPLTLAQVRARDADFHTPRTPHANLGVQPRAIWVRLPVQVVDGDGQWVLDINYAVLHQLDLYQVSAGQLVRQVRLGGVLPVSARPLHSTVPAVALALAPGTPHVLYLRVESFSSMLLPITLRQPLAWQAHEARRSLLQGVLAGFALALLAYSLAHGLSLRNHSFGLYALMLLGTTLFFAHMFGLGQLYLWPEWPALQRRLSPLAVLLALSPAGLFVALTLNTQRHSPHLHRLLLGLSAVTGAGLLLGAFDLLSYPALKALTSVTGLALALVAALASWQQARDGNRAAAYMLVGWGTYVMGGVGLVGLLYGHFPATIGTMHAFQAGWLLEMLAWLQVLGIHVQSVRLQAERSELEKQALQSLAHTDPLTALPNRRGLNLALEAALGDCDTTHPLAVYMLDLDGFKQVNDALGHDAGDALLVAVADRLRDQLQGRAMVARLGGDEFVVLAQHLPTEAEAHALGQRLLQAFAAPFQLHGQGDCQIGLSIGMALAPRDGRQTAALLKRADAAMYTCKQAGGHGLRDHGADAPPTTAVNATARAAPRGTAPALETGAAVHI